MSQVLEILRNKMKENISKRPMAVVELQKHCNQFIVQLLSENALGFTRKDESKEGQMDVNVDFLTIVPNIMVNMISLYEKQIQNKTTPENMIAAMQEFVGLLFVLNQFLTESFDKYYTVDELDHGQNDIPTGEQCLQN